MTQARAHVAARDREIGELSPDRLPERSLKHTPEPAPGRRRSFWRWGILAALAAGVAALYAWSPGADDVDGSGGQRGVRPTTVSVGEVERGAITERATYPGELVADAADLASKIGGRLVDVEVRIGDEVERGQVLARIDASDLRAQRSEAAAQVESADASERRARLELEAARRELERTERLHQREVVSEQEVDNVRDRVASLEQDVRQTTAERSRANARIEVLAQDIREAAIKAPFAGTVVERYADPGAFVQAGSRIARVVENGPLRVRFEVPERDVGAFGKGARFKVRAPPTGQRTLSGTVTGAAREIERQRRIARVEGTVEEPPDSWLAGMYAEVVTARRELQAELLVPSRALVSRLGATGELDHGVFIPHDGVARWVPVRVLGREDDKTAVEGELDVGDRVLTGGHSDLADGGPIQVAGQGDEAGEGEG